MNVDGRVFTTRSDITLVLVSREGADNYKSRRQILPFDIDLSALSFDISIRVV